MTPMRPLRPPEEWSDFVRTIGMIGLVLVWAIGLLLSYVSMFTCRGLVFEGGCRYRGLGYGIFFVVQATAVGTFCLAGIIRLSQAGRRTRPWTVGGSLLVALLILLAGSPW